MEGRITGIHATADNGRLVVTAAVEYEDGTVQKASLPGREKSALVPRSILLGDGRKADLSLLDDINEMLEKMTLGRVVRTWEYRDERYCAFLPWSQITFAARENGNTSAA